MATSIRTILHTTAQRSNLVRFYREGLGLGDPEHSSGEELFQVGDVTLRISSGDSRLRAPVPRTSLTFLVDDLEEHVEHLKAVGVPFDIEPASDGSGSRRAVCRDPDGNFVALLSGPRVARKRKDDDGRPSKASRRKAAKKGKAAKKSVKKAKAGKKKAAKKEKKGKKKKK
jgi:catechol 2,3-dioxygenase-like lactoylglutathione lyase family enzyme